MIAAGHVLADADRGGGRAESGAQQHHARAPRRSTYVGAGADRAAEQVDEHQHQHHRQQQRGQQRVDVAPGQRRHGRPSPGSAAAADAGRRGGRGASDMGGLLGRVVPGGRSGRGRRRRAWRCARRSGRPRAARGRSRPAAPRTCAALPSVATPMRQLRRIDGDDAVAEQRPAAASKRGRVGQRRGPAAGRRPAA